MNTIGFDLDLSKTFDFVDHKLLLKIVSYRITGVAHAWLKSYLSNFNQYV